MCSRDEFVRRLPNLGSGSDYERSFRFLSVQTALRTASGVLPTNPAVSASAKPRGVRKAALKRPFPVDTCRRTTPINAGRRDSSLKRSE